jgi:hypothetical protein
LATVTRCPAEIDSLLCPILAAFSGIGCGGQGTTEAGATRSTRCKFRFVQGDFKSAAEAEKFIEAFYLARGPCKIKS